MVFGPHRYAVGTFANRLDVQQALHELRQAGLKTTQISIVSNDLDVQAPIDDSGTGTSNWENEAPQDVRTTGATVTGSLLGAIGGCLVGLG
ncbi:MAG TPA: general stress protein, partial [Coleofasciculaceae cyanobacterium]